MVRSVCLSIVTSIVFIGSHCWAQPNPSLTPDVNAPTGAAQQEGVEVLSRGPIHEAFAEPVVFNPGPGIVVAKQPPAPIEELPPDQRPEGQNVDWIPGYWAWDDERNNFLWVSGFYRDIPEGRQWIPGYWAQAEQGWQWVSGYWEDAQAQTDQYLPEAPPESLEEGPSTQAPGQDQVWAPGSWMWQQNRYLWRPGYWMASSPEWIWVPPRYVWTPRGYLFINGFWDYPIARRGLLFAPVAFAQPVYLQQTFVYSPTIIVDPGMLTESLFVRPSYCHYYFGDYYANDYARAGVIPWFEFHQRRYGYDPFYAHGRAFHRDRDWDNRIRENFRYRQQHVEARPPRIFGRGDLRVQGDNRLSLVRPLAALAVARNSPVRLQRVTNEQRRELSNRSRAVQNFIGQRNQLETVRQGTALTQDPRPGKAVQNPPRRLQSPIVSRIPEAKGRALPARPEEPKVDPKVGPPIRRSGAIDGKNPRTGVALPTPPRNLPDTNPGKGQPPRQGMPLQPPRVEPRPGPGPERSQPPQRLNPMPRDPQKQPPSLVPQAPRSQPSPPKAQPQPPKVAPQPPKLAPQPPKLAPQPPRAQPTPPKAPPAPPKVQPRPSPPKVMPQPTPRAPDIKQPVRPMPNPPKVAPQPPRAAPQPPAVKPPSKPPAPPQAPKKNPKEDKKPK